MKLVTLLVCVLACTSCLAQYTMTTFYVKNNSDKTMSFRASALKYNSSGQQFEVTVPFTVLPHDSVLARKVRLRKGAGPNVWFSRFTILPVDSISLNDPDIPEN